MDELMIVLVTCAEWPDLSASDRCLAEALQTKGHQVRAAPWNVAPRADFTSADLVVLRSNWDYHHHRALFDDWLAAVESSEAVLQNPAGLVRPFLEKSYLHHVESHGFRIPRTLISADFDLDHMHTWMDQHELDLVVIKPAWGASGHGVEQVRRESLGQFVKRWRSAEVPRPMVVQEFMPQIRDGEQSLVFLGGVYSHTLVRRPADNDFRVNGQYGGEMELLADVDPTMIEFAARVEASLPEPATYARIDALADGADHVVMEVEVNEPALGLHLAPGSAERFANSLVG